MGFIERAKRKACHDLHEKVGDLERAQRFINESINYAIKFDRPDVAKELESLFRMTPDQYNRSLKKGNYSPTTRLIEMISRVIFDEVGSIYQMTFQKAKRNEEIDMKEVYDAKKILQLHYRPRGFYPIPREEINQNEPHIDLYQIPWGEFAINIGFAIYQKTTILLPFGKSINVLPRVKVRLEKVRQESRNIYPSLSKSHRF